MTTDPTEKEIAESVAQLALTVTRPVSNGALLELLTRAVHAGIEIGVRKTVKACELDSQQKDER